MHNPALPRRSLLTLLCLLSLAGCASPKVSQDYLELRDFSVYQTYNWRKLTNEAPQLEDARLRQLTDQQLASQGLNQRVDESDLILDMTLLVQAQKASSISIGLGVGIPLGSNGGIGVGGSQPGERKKLQGLLLVDLTDRATNELIWRGTAETIPLRDLDARNTTGLTKILAALLSQFPPSAAKP